MDWHPLVAAALTTSTLAGRVGFCTPPCLGTAVMHLPMAALLLPPMTHRSHGVRDRGRNIHLDARDPDPLTKGSSQACSGRATPVTYAMVGPGMSDSVIPDRCAVEGPGMSESCDFSWEHETHEFHLLRPVWLYSSPIREPTAQVWVQNSGSCLSSATSHETWGNLSKLYFSVPSCSVGSYGVISTDILNIQVWV